MASTMTHSEKHAGSEGSPEQIYQSNFVPRFDIWEGAEGWMLYGDLPGVSADDLDIRFENRELTIRGKVAPRHEGDFLFDEYEVGDFHRTFTVGESIDAEKISAEMHNGVLKLLLPKTEKLKPRKIDIKVT